MKPNIRSSKFDGFTLIEMVGVLAVIAILAALLVPKIFAAINDSRFSNSVASINSTKTATMDYFGKKGNFPTTGAFDTLLVTENCLERPLACKVAASSVAEVVDMVAADNPTGLGGAYTLSGVATDKIVGDKVVQVKLSNVVIEDARELSRRIDGEPTAVAATSLTTLDATPVAADTKGRVTYAAAAAGATTTVYIYIAHK